MNVNRCLEVMLILRYESASKPVQHLACFQAKEDIAMFAELEIPNMRVRMRDAWFPLHPAKLKMAVRNMMAMGIFTFAIGFVSCSR